MLRRSSNRKKDEDKQPDGKKPSGTKQDGEQKKKKPKSYEIPEIVTKEQLPEEFVCKSCQEVCKKFDTAIYMLPDESKMQHGIIDKRRDSKRARRETVLCRACYRKFLIQDLEEDEYKNYIQTSEIQESLSFICPGAYIKSYKPDTFILFRKVIEEGTETCDKLMKIIKDKNYWKPPAVLNGGATIQYLFENNPEVAKEIYHLELRSNKQKKGKLLLSTLAARAKAGTLGDLIKTGAYILRQEDIEFREPMSFSILSSAGKKIKRQVPHGDAANDDYISILLYLGKSGGSPTMFYQYPVVRREIDAQGAIRDWVDQKLADDLARGNLHDKFLPLLSLCPEELGKQMYPCVDSFEFGDLLIFESHTIHCGPEADKKEDRVLLFTTLAPEGRSHIPEDESQITPTFVAQAVYGEKDPRYYATIHAWSTNVYYEDQKIDMKDTFNPGMKYRYERYEEMMKKFTTEVIWKKDEEDKDNKKKKRKKK